VIQTDDVIVLGDDQSLPIFGSLDRAVQVIAERSLDEASLPESRTGACPGPERFPSIRMLIRKVPGIALACLLPLARPFARFRPRGIENVGAHLIILELSSPTLGPG
jgi:hypothetical protein